MRKSKKITALILAAMLAVSSSAAMAVTVSAEEDTAVAYSSSDTKSWGDYDYQVLDDGTVEITDYKGSDTNLVIPSEIDGKKVTSVGISAFYYCESLTNIEIPDSVTNIGDGAFMCCTNLTEVKIPNSVTSIGSYAFTGCTSLKEITVDKDNQNYSSVNGVLFNKNKTELIAYPDQKGNTYTIPDSVTSIGESAFHSCSLTNITIPDGVTYIGRRAFEDCTNLTEVKIPDSVTSIENWVFSGCTSLTNITLSDGVTSIGENTFVGCTSLTNIKIPNSVTKIGGGVFNSCTSLTNIEIPDSVTSIGDGVFGICTSLTNIEIPDSVTSIGDVAFAYCTSLTEVKIPNSVTYIGSEAFKDCNNLTIYGYVGSTAETYAKENNIPFVDINSKVLTSKVNNISVKGTFDDGVTLNVEEATVKNAVKAYNITLKDENGNTIQPNGKITVSIPSDNANCKVYWIKEDGTKVDMNATYSNGNYEFTTDHLSVYALIADTTESSSEESNTTSDSNNNGDTNNTDSGKTPSETGKNAVNTGDNNNAVAIATIFAIGALIAAIIMRKKKA